MSDAQISAGVAHNAQAQRNSSAITRGGRQGKAGKPKGSSKNERRYGLGFAMPFLIGLVLFTIGPMIASLYYSFTDFNIMTAPKWVGMHNYQSVFADPRFYKSLENTAYLTFIGVPLGLAFALGVALILNLKEAPARGLARALSYIPAIIPSAVVAYLWRWMFNGRYGLINVVLTKLGIPAPNWLLDPAWTRPAVILISLWTVGGTTVIYLAALRDVPRELMEAAALDGCGVLRRFRYVTLPAIAPVTVFQLIAGLLGGLQNFTIPYLLGSGGFNMSTGGPDETWLTYAVYLYQNAFSYFKMGYASALAWILFIIALILTAVILRLSKGVDEDAAH